MLQLSAQIGDSTCGVEVEKLRRVLRLLSFLLGLTA